MGTTITATLKSLAVLATLMIALPVLSQTEQTKTSPEKKKVEKRIEICNENGKEKVTITTTHGSRQKVQVMEGAEAKQWMEENENGSVSGSGKNEDGQQIQKVVVRSSDGSEEDIMIKQRSQNDKATAYSYSNGDGNSTVMVNGKEVLTFTPDATSGMYKLRLDIEGNEKGVLYVNDAKGNVLLKEELVAKGPQERQVKVDPANGGEYTIGFKGEGTVIVKKLMID